MTKQEFMRELESLLYDISSEEREEALKFYKGYFEDAGEEQESAVIAELGSPKQVADIIKAELSSNTSEHNSRGFFTEKGYQETITNEFELTGINHEEAQGAKAGGNQNSYKQNTYNQNSYSQKSYSQNQNNPYGQQGEKQQSRRRTTNIGLIIILCIIALPVALPLLFSAFGVAVGLIAALVGIIIGIGATGIALICAGVVLLVVGVIQMSVPLVGLAVCGIGLAILGIGMLLSLACGALCTKLLPAIIRGIVHLCRMPFQNRSVMA